MNMEDIKGEMYSWGMNRKPKLLDEEESDRYYKMGGAGPFHCATYSGFDKKFDIRQKNE
jgi:hypothetical protein